MKCGNHLADINTQGPSPLEQEQRELLDDVLYQCVCVCVWLLFEALPQGNDFCFFLHHQHCAVRVCQWSDLSCTCVSGRPQIEHASITERDDP